MGLHVHKQLEQGEREMGAWQGSHLSSNLPLPVIFTFSHISSETQLTTYTLPSSQFTVLLPDKVGDEPHIKL